jgi:hypothetical protein
MSWSSDDRSGRPWWIPLESTELSAAPFASIPYLFGTGAKAARASRPLARARPGTAEGAREPGERLPPTGSVTRDGLGGAAWVERSHRGRSDADLADELYGDLGDEEQQQAVRMHHAVKARLLHQQVALECLRPSTAPNGRAGAVVAGGRRPALSAAGKRGVRVQQVAVQAKLAEHPELRQTDLFGAVWKLDVPVQQLRSGGAALSWPRADAAVDPAAGRIRNPMGTGAEAAVEAVVGSPSRRGHGPALESSEQRLDDRPWRRTLTPTGTGRPWGKPGHFTVGGDAADIEPAVGVVGLRGRKQRQPSSSRSSLPKSSLSPVLGHPPPRYDVSKPPPAAKGYEHPLRDLTVFVPITPMINPDDLVISPAAGSLPRPAAVLTTHPTVSPMKPLRTLEHPPAAASEGLDGWLAGQSAQMEAAPLADWPPSSP